HQVALLAKALAGSLAVLRGVADAVARGPRDLGEPTPEHLDHGAGVVDGEGRLGQVGDLGRIAYLQPLRGLHRVDDHDPRGRLARRPDHLVVILVAHQVDGEAVPGVPDRLRVDLGDERTGRVDV